MVNIDQLRISDDGTKIFIDAHVNKASYFDDVYLKSVTICTEDQISELQDTHNDNFIYRYDCIPLERLVPIYSETQMLSENVLLDRMLENGGWRIAFEGVEGAESNAISFVFSGKFPSFTTGFEPKLVAASNDFDPTTDSLQENSKILFMVDGTLYNDDTELNVWQFRGKKDVEWNTVINFYLYKQTEQGTYEYVRLDSTIVDNSTHDYNYLHFLWNAYSLIAAEEQKEVHLVLDKGSFDEAFNNTATEEGIPVPINPDLPIATVAFSGNDLSHNMFFIYFECEGSPAPSTPCTLDEPTLGVTFDYGIFFNTAMNYTKDLIKDCNIAQDFEDFILNTEALKLSIETGHYVNAIGFWKNLLGRSNSTTSGTTNCGCHG